MTKDLSCFLMLFDFFLTTTNQKSNSKTEKKKLKKNNNIKIYKLLKHTYINTVASLLFSFGFAFFS